MCLDLPHMVTHTLSPVHILTTCLSGSQMSPYIPATLTWRCPAWAGTLTPRTKGKEQLWLEGLLHTLESTLHRPGQIRGTPSLSGDSVGQSDTCQGKVIKSSPPQDR